MAEEKYERIIKQLEHRIELKRETVKLYKIRNKELKDENNKLLDVINNQDVKIADLEKQNELIAQEGGKSETKRILAETKLEQAKEIIRNIIRVTWGEGWNYSLDVKARAEQFLKENSNG